MALLIRENDKLNSTATSEFLVESAADVLSLPTSTTEGANGLRKCYFGSVAYTPDLLHIYMLGQDDVWHELLEE